MRDWAKKQGHPLAKDGSFYQLLVRGAHITNAVGLGYQAAFDLAWEEHKRPYYNVYPTIIPMLTALNLDFDSSLIEMPTLDFSEGQPSPLVIRFPVSLHNPLKFTTETKGSFVNGVDPSQPVVRSILFGRAVVCKTVKALAIYIDIGETSNSTGYTMPDLSYRILRLQEGVTVEESIREASANNFPGAVEGVQIPQEIVIDCTRLVCSVCLLEDNPEIISPEVLSDDLSKYEATLDPKYIQKAHRRGKVGWSVGKDYEKYEVIPHTRRPHPVLVWTGPGRQIPKIVMRKGSIVHRGKLNPPTGFEDK